MSSMITHFWRTAFVRLFRLLCGLRPGTAGKDLPVRRSKRALYTPAPPAIKPALPAAVIKSLERDMARLRTEIAPWTIPDLDITSLLGRDWETVEAAEEAPTEAAPEVDGTKDETKDETKGETKDETKGLPIRLVSKEGMSLMERREFEHKHPTEEVFEHILLPLDIKNLQKDSRIPFEHLDTPCELIMTAGTILLSEETAASHVLIKRPDIYYRSPKESPRFPCECLCAVDEATFQLFDCAESVEERAYLIGVYARLSKAQREHVRLMASRPVQQQEDTLVEAVEDFTPIRDEKALDMLYKVCKDTYSPAVRSRAESLRVQLKSAHGSDRVDLINQLAFTVGIDTAARAHPTKTYEECRAIMDKHIYGMDELKEAVIEFIISMQQSGVSYFALLLVGPPGVGKTCVCDAVAECMEVPIVHIDCSGVDTITMSGLIKSYSGAKAGKFMDGIFEKGRTDVLVRLDEVDKMARGKDGDPYGALIKPLGPQRKYYDEYVADDTDVSATKFIATANDMSNIPGYILSRFENCIFYIDPYTEDEKLEIALHHSIPKKLAEFRLRADECIFEESALRLIIREYCSDQGVRELNGNITMLLRKAITQWSRGMIQKPFLIDCDYVQAHLKKARKPAGETRIGFAS